MADYRQIHTCIWKDSWFIDLASDHKLLFIYLFSNERANLAGLYDLSLKVIAFETDLDQDTIMEALGIFATADKVLYRGGMVWVPNLLRHNARNITSPKIQAHLRTIISNTRDCELKSLWIEQYNGMVPEPYRMHTLSIPDPESDSEQEQEQEQEREQEQRTAPEPHTPTNGRHPAFTVYEQLSGQIITAKIQMDDIIAFVPRDDTSIARWGQVVRAWIGMGWKPRNITGMLDHFREGRIPGRDFLEVPRGPPTPQEPVIISSAAFNATPGVDT